MPRLIFVASRQVVALATLLGGLGGITTDAQPSQNPVVRAATVRAAEVGDDERFGMSLAADRLRAVMFLSEPFSWGSPPSDADRGSPSSVDEAFAKYRRHHPYLSFRKLRHGIFVAALPLTHCAAPVLNQQINRWSFTGSYRDFERAFDRRLHGLENVVEGDTLGPPPVPESPMLTPITISVQMTTGLETLLQALEQLPGAVLIFREYSDKRGESHCVRETYTRDATLTTAIGYDRNSQRFARPGK